MGASNLKLILISSTWDCTTFHNFLPMFKKIKIWQVFCWLAKLLIMSGYMDLKRPRVYRRSNVGLVLCVVCVCRHGPLTRYVKLRVLQAPGMPGTFPCHRLQRKPLVSDPVMHHGTCVTHLPWCMPGSLIRSGKDSVPGIPGACATSNFTYLVRGPLSFRFVVNIPIAFRIISLTPRQSHDD